MADKCFAPPERRTAPGTRSSLPSYMKTPPQIQREVGRSVRLETSFPSGPAHGPSLLEGAMGSAVLDGFAIDSADLTEEHLSELDELAGYLTLMATLQGRGLVWVVGYTDEAGTPEHNLQLGMNRAEAVRQALVARGVEAGRVEIDSRGETELVGRQHGYDSRNRRVVVSYQRPQSSLRLGISPIAEQVAETLRPPPALTEEDVEEAARPILAQMVQQIRERGPIEGFLRQPHEGPPEETPRIAPETVRQGLVDFVSDLLSFLGPLAGPAARGIVDGVDDALGAGVEEFVLVDNPQVRSLLGAIVQGLARLLVTRRLQPVTEPQEEIRLEAPRRVEGMPEGLERPAGVINLPGIPLGRRGPSEYQQLHQREEREREEERLRQERRRYYESGTDE